MFRVHMVGMVHTGNVLCPSLALGQEVIKKDQKHGTHRSTISTSLKGIGNANNCNCKFSYIYFFIQLNTTKME